MIIMGPYSKNFIFFVTYKLARGTRVLHYSRLEMVVREKHSSLLDPFVSYAKNKASRIFTQKLTHDKTRAIKVLHWGRLWTRIPTLR
jgi:hypothetical protein